jgi:hypothetical protein
LIPKKAKDFIKPTAEELNVPTELVEDLANFFWDEVHRSVNAMAYHRIDVPGLGVFTSKPKKLEEFKLRCEKILSREAVTPQEKAIRRDIEDRIGKANGLLKLWEMEQVRRQKKMKKRYG